MKKDKIKNLEKKDNTFFLKRIFKACNVTEILSICVVSAALTLNLILGISAQIRSEKISDDNGYQKANAEHYSMQVEEIDKLHKEGKISNSECYDRKTKIFDLNRDEFMATSENVSKEAREEYESCKERKEDLVKASMATSIGFGLLGLAGNLGAECAGKLLQTEEEDEIVK